MTVHELVECLFAAGDWGRVGDIPSLEAKIRVAVIEEESVTWARKYSMENATGVSLLVGRFFNGYRLDLENVDIPDGDYWLIPKAKP